MHSNNSLGYVLDRTRDPLLTAADEVRLSRLVQEMIKLQAELGDTPPSPEQRRIIKRGMRARDRMLLANVRLVAVICDRYSYVTSFLRDEDLFQNGMIGLCRAVEKFDASRGYKFSTYAFWWIRQAITRSITVSEFPIRMGQTTRNKVVKLRDYILETLSETGKRPTPEQCMKKFGLRKADYDLYSLHAPLDAVSLDQNCKGGSKRDDSETTRIGDFLVDDGISPEQHTLSAERLEMARTIAAAVPHIMEPNTATIVSMHLGINGFTQKSLAEIARKIGIERGRVSNLYQRGLRTLQKYALQKGAREAMEVM